jgi:hypothetical protein
LGKEHKLQVSKNKVLGNFMGHKKDKIQKIFKMMMHYEKRVISTGHLLWLGGINL